MLKKNTFNPEIDKRSVFMLEVYPDSDTYNYEDVLARCRSFNEWVYILHDKDVNSNGELKKAHYHVVIRTVPSLLSTIVNKTGVPSNYIKIDRQFRWAVRYLRHIDDVSKYQYPIESVVSNLEDVGKYYRVLSEVSLVIDMAEMRSNGSTWFDLLNYSKENNCYDVLRRNWSFISTIVNEVNGQ